MAPRPTGSNPNPNPNPNSNPNPNPNQAAARRKGANLQVQARRLAARNMRSVVAIQAIRRGVVERRKAARAAASREETALLIEIEARQPLTPNPEPQP